MPKIKEMLDWQIHFNQDGGDKVLPFYWADEKGEIYNDRPLTGWEQSQRRQIHL